MGKAADLAVWRCAHPRELAYRMGANPLQTCFVQGKERTVHAPVLPPWLREGVNAA